MEQTEIKITIQTDYQHETGDRFTVARQQIEKSSYYLQSLFGFIKGRAEKFEETTTDREEAVFFAELTHLSELGHSVALSICDPLLSLEQLNAEESISEVAE